MIRDGCLTVDKTEISEAGDTLTYTATLSSASQGVTTIQTTLGTITIADGQFSGTLNHVVSHSDDLYLDSGSVSTNISGLEPGGSAVSP